MMKYADEGDNFGNGKLISYLIRMVGCQTQGLPMLNKELKTMGIVVMRMII